MGSCPSILFVLWAALPSIIDIFWPLNQSASLFWSTHTGCIWRKSILSSIISCKGSLVVGVDLFPENYLPVDNLSSSPLLRAQMNWPKLYKSPFFSITGGGVVPLQVSLLVFKLIYIASKITGVIDVIFFSVAPFCTHLFFSEITYYFIFIQTSRSIQWSEMIYLFDQYINSSVVIFNVRNPPVLCFQMC